MAFELPEAITVARQMETELLGKRVRAVTLGEKNACLVQQGFIDLDGQNLAGRRFGPVVGRGKWIAADLEPDLCMLIALESGGRVLYHAPGWQPTPQSGIRFEIEGHGILEIQLIGWGFVRVTTRAAWQRVSHPVQLGIAPLDGVHFTLPVMRSLLAAHAGKNLKAFFIDQRQVAGIGSGYLQDILYRARLHPLRLAGSLVESEQERLFYAILHSLQTALALGGRESEVNLYGIPGGYTPAMSGQLRGRPCPECGSRIEKLLVQGGAVYLCPGCQPPARADVICGFPHIFVRIR